jgi:hypothetical protein
VACPPMRRPTTPTSPSCATTSSSACGATTRSAVRPIDYNGHGSHTAGTAAGGFADGVSANVGEDEVPGNSFDVSGVAPHANIISYAACCTGLALLSAVDQMIVDDIDVLNFSIGSTSPTADLLQDGLTFGFLVARLTGIHVANSAGNSGPGSGTIGSPSDAPWVTSVASSTHDRLALNAVTGLPDDVFDDGQIEGKGVSAPLEDATELVYAGDLDDAEDNALCLPDVWDEGDLDGVIVVCDRGEIGRVDKSEAAAAAGAVGFVLANDQANAGSIQGRSTATRSRSRASTSPTTTAWRSRTGWRRPTSPTATIAGTSFDVADRWGDTVSIFSSRGPNGHDANLLSPQVTARGPTCSRPTGGRLDRVPVHLRHLDVGPARGRGVRAARGPVRRRAHGGRGPVGAAADRPPGRARHRRGDPGVALRRRQRAHRRGGCRGDGPGDGRRRVRLLRHLRARVGQLGAEPRLDGPEPVRDHLQLGADLHRRTRAPTR